MTSVHKDDDIPPRGTLPSIWMGIQTVVFVAEARLDAWWLTIICKLIKFFKSKAQLFGKLLKFFSIFFFLDFLQDTKVPSQNNIPQRTAAVNAQEMLLNIGEDWAL